MSVQACHCWRTTAMSYVRFGSKADIGNAKRHVRFTPESGHVRCNSVCPLSANSGHSVATSAAAFLREGQNFTKIFRELPVQAQPSSMHAIECDAFHIRNRLTQLH